MTERFVEYRGVRMIEGWPERIQAAQLVHTYYVEGATRQRIRYGDESEDLGADGGPCPDCHVNKGEFHVPGCNEEQCPVCDGSIFWCDCEREIEEYTEED